MVPGFVSLAMKGCDAGTGMHKVLTWQTLLHTMFTKTFF